MGIHYYYFKCHANTSRLHNIQDIRRKKIAIEVSRHQNENVTASRTDSRKMLCHILILYLRYFCFFFICLVVIFPPKMESSIACITKIELMEEEMKKRKWNIGKRNKKAFGIVNQSLSVSWFYDFICRYTVDETGKKSS